MTVMGEGKIIIDDGETADANHIRVELDYKKRFNFRFLQPLLHVSSSNVEEGIIMLQFESFEPNEVFVFKKSTNTSKVHDFSNDKNGDTWTLIAHKRQKHQETSKLRLSTINTRSSANQLQLH